MKSNSEKFDFFMAAALTGLLANDDTADSEKAVVDTAAIFAFFAVEASNKYEKKAREQ